MFQHPSFLSEVYVSELLLQHPHPHHRHYPQAAAVDAGAGAAAADTVDDATDADDDTTAVGYWLPSTRYYRRLATTTG